MKQIVKIKEFRLLCWVTATNISIACAFFLMGLFMQERILPPDMPVTQASSLFASYAAA